VHDFPLGRIKKSCSCARRCPGSSLSSGISVAEARNESTHGGTSAFTMASDKPVRVQGRPNARSVPNLQPSICGLDFRWHLTTTFIISTSEAWSFIRGREKGSGNKSARSSSSCGCYGDNSPCTPRPFATRLEFRASIARRYSPTAARIAARLATLPETPLRKDCMLELGTDSYTEVVPAPQGGRLS
jgi:hypothetical protein